MTFAGLIMTIGIIIVFTQWQTPLIFMHMKGIVSDRKFKNMKRIGNILSFILIPLMFVALYSYQAFPSLTNTLLISVGAVILSMIGYSIYLYDKSSKSLINEDTSIKRSMKMPLIIMVVPFLASIYEFVLLQYLPQGFVSIEAIVNFQLTSNIAFIMILRIFLFSFVIVTAYVYMVYSAIHDKEPNEQGLLEIKSRLRKKRIYFVITISVILSFFHLAEVDTYTVATTDEVIELCGSEESCDVLNTAYAKYDEKFDSTLDVFYLIATALFIPLFIDELHSSDKSDNSNRYWINHHRRIKRIRKTKLHR